MEKIKPPRLHSDLCQILPGRLSKSTGFLLIEPTARRMVYLFREPNKVRRAHVREQRDVPTDSLARVRRHFFEEIKGEFRDEGHEEIDEYLEF